MPEKLRNLPDRGVYEDQDLAALARIHHAVCAALDIPPDDMDGCSIAARAVFFAFDRGVRDVEQLTRNAIIASRASFLERSRSAA